MIDRLRRSARQLLYLFRRATHDAALGAGRAGWIQVAGAHVLLAVAELAGLRLRLAIPLRMRLGGTRRTVWVADRSQLYAMADIFLDGEYAAASASDPRVILDLGAHIGGATLYFRQRFPGARIYAVEPDVSTLRCLRRNVGRLPGVEILPCAVGGRSGRAMFESSSHSSASRLAIDGTAAEGVETHVLSFDDLLDRLELHHVELVKLDIEGAEFELLEAASRLTDVDQLVGEFHPHHPHAPPDVRDWLEGIARRSGLGLVAPEAGRDVFVLNRLT